MASKRIRVALDLDVEEGSEEDIVAAIFEARKAAGSSIVHVLLPEDPKSRAEGARVKVIAGATHLHEITDGRCNICVQYAKAEMLIPVEL